MNNNVVCPLCGKSFKGLPAKSWQYRDYDVGNYKCTHCERRFMLYQNPEKTYTIPKRRM